MIKNIIFLFILFTIFQKVNIYAFEGGKDTNYIKPFKHSIAITFASSNRFLNAKYYNLNSGHDLFYRPTPFLSNGFELDNSIFSIGYNPNFMAINGKKSKYGEGDHSSYRFSFSLWAFYTELDLQLYRGYYLANSADYLEYQGKGLYKQPDMTTLFLGANIYFALNYNKYAFTCPVNYNAMQIKSAGSALFGISTAATFLTNPTGIVPPDIKQYFDTNKNLKIISHGFYTLNAGYGYNFAIKKKFYISIAELFGFGISNLNYQSDDNSIKKYRNGFALQNFTRFGAGFNNGSWYVGVNMFYQNFYNFDIKRTIIEFDKVSFKVFFGKLLYLKPCKNKKADKFFTALGF